MKPTALRANLYAVLDQILKTGEPVEIERAGRRLRIAPVRTDDRLATLEPHPEAINGDVDDIHEISWEREWNP